MNKSDRMPWHRKSDHVERVRSFFNTPENYLDRKRFDIRIRAETTKMFLDGRPCQKLLDIGCGDGSVSLPLLSSERHLTLLDISENMLALARQRVPSHLASNVEIRLEDFLHSSLEKGSFDAIICVGVLAHVSSPDDVILKAAALLKPGGTLVLECTDSFHVVRRLMALPGRMINWRKGLEFRLNELSGARVLEMATRHGFEFSSAFRYSWPPPGSQRIFSQEFLYRTVRWTFGDVRENRNRGLGFEYIFCLSRR